MSNVRKFYLLNAKGEKYDLNDLENKVVLSNPTGLGFASAIGIDRRGYQAEAVADVPNLPIISGELIFYQPTNALKYEAYQNFIKFAKFNPLKLFYQTPNTFDTFFIDCVISQLQKGEVSSSDSALHCPITIQGLSFWKTDVEYDEEVSEVIVGGKKYPYTFPYDYEGNSFAHIEIKNNGDIDCGFNFEVYGRVQDPILSLTQDGVKYGEISISGTYTKIIVDTRDGQQNIRLEVNGSAIANPTSKFILSGNGTYETPFPKLRIGDNVLTFAFGGTFEDTIHIKWRDICLSR